MEEKQKKCGCLSGGDGGGEKTTKLGGGGGSGGKKIKMWQWWRYIAPLFTELC